MTRIFVLGAIGLVVAVTLAGGATAAAPTLTGTVGPGFTITLTKGGKKVTRLSAGRYQLVVRDRLDDAQLRPRGTGSRARRHDRAVQGNKNRERQAAGGQVQVLLPPTRVVDVRLREGDLTPARPAPPGEAGATLAQCGASRLVLQSRAHALRDRPIVAGLLGPPGPCCLGRCSPVRRRNF